jgi:cellulose synthase/poly-beta-1,6-N-acetylglucosamine synthase-like glycosyltransferase
MEKQTTNFENNKDFLFREEVNSIRRHIHLETVLLIFFVVAFFGAALYFLKDRFGISVAIAVSAIISVFYLALMIFKLYIVYKSSKKKLVTVSPEELNSLNESELPVMTVIVPLYREEEVIPQIMDSMTSIDYPKDKLQVLITVESYDWKTRQAIEIMNPPENFKVITLPDVSPKTKPKALNVAFREARGEYVVIYDAEIIPDPQQLKKAYLGFKKNPDIGCLQTRLDHYNSHENVITKLFNAEFSFYYDLFLPGLTELGFPVPLSGHSTIFRRQVLVDIGAWDPYNVAEDCDMGMMIKRAGWKTDILDSVSREEATGEVGAWVRQRTRWMKGFIQTSIVHLRHPVGFVREIGGIYNFLGFFLTVPGTVLLNFFNLFYWFLLIAWVITGSATIKYFFPGPILYISVFSFILGNFIFTFLNLVGSYKRQRYEMVKYSLISPLYWMLLAYATVRAVFQIVIRPHHWEKTVHHNYVSYPNLAVQPAS